MKAKPGQQAAHRRARRLDDFVAAQAKRRQHGIRAACGRHAPTGRRQLNPAATSADWAGQIRRQDGGPLPAAAAFALHTGGDGPRPPAGFRPRHAAPTARARGARLGPPRLPQARDRRAAWSSGSTTCAALFRWRSISARMATRSPRRWASARPSDCLVRADLGQGFAAAARGPAVVADEEALPFAPQQLRPGAERDGPALGQRPARHADPDRAHPEARRAVPGRHAGRRHACGSCARR